MNLAVSRNSALAISFICQLNQKHADVRALTEEFESQTKSQIASMLAVSKKMGFKAKLKKVDYKKLKAIPSPALTLSKDGGWCVLAGVSENGVLVQHIDPGKITTLTFEQASEQLSSEVIFLRLAVSNSSGKFGYSWFLKSLKPFQKIFWQILLASAVVQCFATVTPLFFQVVMDKVIVHQGLSTLTVLGIGYIVIIIFDVLLTTVRNYLMSHTSSRVDLELGSKLFNHLINLPLPYFEKRAVGQTVARVKELDSIRNFITGTSLTSIVDFFFTFIFFGIMWNYSTTLTIIVMISIPAYAVLSFAITPLFKRSLENKFTASANSTAFLTESINGMQAIKGLSIENGFQREWENKLTEQVKSTFETQNISNVSSQIGSLISKTVTLLIVWMGALEVMDGQLTIGQLVAFNMFAGRVNQPLLKLISLWQEYQQANLSVKKLADILTRPVENSSMVSRSNNLQVSGAISFDSVNFRYNADLPLVLRDFSLNIKSGEMVSLVGRSGSGKSTVAKLIQRMYLPESGHISIDGIDLQKVDVNWLRKQIGFVHQDSLLFSKSIKENISLGNPMASEKEVLFVSELSGAHEFISALPYGYETVIEEQGKDLSGGQKQRIAIARALLSNPKILIFDEATSALDYESESIIQRNMKRISQGRTVIQIAHRLSTVLMSDVIVYMDAGRIVEKGTHKELIELKGLYNKLYNAQYNPQSERV